MTITHSHKELTSQELVEPTTIKGAGLSSGLSSRRLTSVTILTFHTICLQTGRVKRSPLSVTPNEGEISTTTAVGLREAY